MWGIATVVLSPHKCLEHFQWVYFKCLPLLNVNCHIDLPWCLGLGMANYALVSLASKLSFLQCNWGFATAHLTTMMIGYKSFMVEARLHIPVFMNLFFGPKKPFLPGFLRISYFSCVFRRNFSQECGFGGGRRNSCFLPLSQDFFSGIPVGQEFLYLLRIPPDSSGFLWIPVPAKRCLAMASD